VRYQVRRSWTNRAADDASEMKRSCVSDNAGIALAHRGRPGACASIWRDGDEGPVDFHSRCRINSRALQRTIVSSTTRHRGTIRMRAYIFGTAALTLAAIQPATAANECATRFPSIAQLDDRLKCIEKKIDDLGADKGVSFRSVRHQHMCIYAANEHQVAMRRCDEGEAVLNQFRIQGP
jgi:hypothetical protein